MHDSLIFVLAFCLAISFLMSGMEVGVFALSPLRIRQQMRAGNRRAQVLYGYLENPEDFLWTILIGNTLANVTIVTIGFLGLHQLIGQWFQLFVVLLVLAGTLFYALCELLPKMLFRLYPNRLCLSLTLPFRAVHFAIRPLVSFMSFLAHTLLRGSNGKGMASRLFGSRDELRVLMQESAQGLTSEERTMINHVLDLQNLTVGQIAVPLNKTVMASVETPLSELLSIYRQRGFNRLPVWRTEQGRQRLVGFVSLRQFIFAEDLDLSKTASDYVQPALFLSAETRLELALRQMQRTSQRLAIVLGRDRAELGIISLEDILRVIFGEVKI